MNGFTEKAELPTTIKIYRLLFQNLSNLKADLRSYDVITVVE